jgi:RHS repeat-associated protein
MGYQQADLSSITDGLGRTTSLFPDGVGRVEVLVDPLGNRVQMAYDPLDRLTQVTNPLNGKTILTYDQNGNVLTVTDPRNAGHHNYAYDQRNRLHTYTDPLGSVETYNYDGLGNLTSKVDRKGQTTSFLYDPLNRLQKVTYADVSTVTLTWDAGNRPQTIVDSANGTITQTYDGLDRLTAEVSPQGQVSYQYDAAGRRTVLTTTVSGNAQSLNYYYDNANRLTQIKSGSTVLLGLGYDTANRRTSITYPNGVVRTSGFDAANEILSLSYDHGATHIGDLAYTYDIGGRQSTESGSLAQVSTPAAVAAMTYNAANRLTAIGSVTPTFDNNGNLLSNGTATYTWNARNQLIGTNAGSAVYTYDALGRRVNTTIGGVSTSYLHDGQNPVALNGTMFLEGPGLDEVYGKLASAGATSYLRDALGSTIAVSNSSATTTSSYAYSSYGSTAITGSADSPFQYTGRENDAAANLYYYRARYYSPQLGRFISEDPIGLNGGINTYAYANGNPINFRDPTGKDPFLALIGAVGGFGYGYISGLIEGQSGSDLYLHALEDAGIGGLTGLTDGLNLVPRVLANVGINAVGEGYKEWVSYMSTGCPREFNGTKIALAGATGVLGDLGGNLVGHALAGRATALTHILQESSLSIEQFVNANINGALSLAAPIIDRVTH